VVQTTQYYTAVSIDGFVADSDNSLDWLVKRPSTPERDERFQSFIAGVGAMAMGAATYEWVLDNEHLLDRPDKWQEFYGDVPSWVFTHREPPAVPGADITFVRGGVAEVHAAMADRAGDKNVWMVGGGRLAAQFAAAGLIDRVILGVAPVTLGAGAPLLPWRSPGDLRLVDVDRDEDFVYLTYDVPAPAR
jgi:dihydrofolate reductase